VAIGGRLHNMSALCYMSTTCQFSSENHAPYHIISYISYLSCQ